MIISGNDLRFLLSFGDSKIGAVARYEVAEMYGVPAEDVDGHGLETDSGAQGHRKYGKTFFVWIRAGVEIPFRVWQLLGTLGHKIYFLRPVIPEKTVQELEKIARENNFQDKFTECENTLLE